MPLGDESFGAVIAGAASLRGKDLRHHAEESGFPAGEIRLIDEELAAGTLTDLGGEPAVIQAVDETSFERMRFAFFAGSPQFSEKHTAAAVRAGATVIDLAGGVNPTPGARPWIPRLNDILPPPGAGEGGSAAAYYLAPSTAAIVAISLSAAFSTLPLTRLAISFFLPVSERGQAGVDELENQTSKLLTFQPIPQEVFETQVAFNLVDRWGAESGERLADLQTALEREVRKYLVGRAVVPAMTLLQAPVFYGNAFSVYAEFGAKQDASFLSEKLSAAGFALAEADDPSPSNVSVAGEAQPAVRVPVADPNVDCGYWLWGAADNLRVASANAMRIAETLLVT